jgi:cell division protein FtsB
MKTHRSQRGMGLLGMLLIAIMVGFFVMSAIRIAPGYLQYLSVRDIVIRVAEEYQEEQDTIADIRRKIADYFNTNQIKAIDPREVEITRKEGRVIIDASYEERIPLVWRIDAVVKYDDLAFIAGETYSD